MCVRREEKRSSGRVRRGSMAVTDERIDLSLDHQSHDHRRVHQGDARGDRAQINQSVALSCAEHQKMTSASSRCRWARDIARCATHSASTLAKASSLEASCVRLAVPRPASSASHDQIAIRAKNEGFGFLTCQGTGRASFFLSLSYALSPALALSAAAAAAQGGALFPGLEPPKIPLVQMR
jgi:hypothetical protein